MAEPLTLLLMVACFGVLAVRARWPIGVSLAAAAWLGAALNGDYLPLRHLVEGAFSYLDPILVIATAMIFMRVLADGGALAAVGPRRRATLGSRPVLLLPALMLIVMFPGMMHRVLHGVRPDDRRDGGVDRSSGSGCRASARRRSSPWAASSAWWRRR